MLHYYVVTCADMNPEKVLGEAEYVHVKARVDGMEIAIISLEEFPVEKSEGLIVEKSEKELQLILDKWIDAENVDPLLDEERGKILQVRINLDNFRGASKWLTGQECTQIRTRWGSRQAQMAPTR